MADRPGGRTIPSAQVLLSAAAAGLWAASRLPWVTIRSFDSLGPPTTTTVFGARWSAGLLPLAVLLVVAAVAALAVRGWPLRMLAVLVAIASLATGYLAVSLWVIPDAAVRAADVAHVSVLSLVGSERHYLGAAITLSAAVCALARRRVATAIGPFRPCPVDEVCGARRPPRGGARRRTGDLGADALGCPR